MVENVGSVRVILVRLLQFDSVLKDFRCFGSTATRIPLKSIEWFRPCGGGGGVADDWWYRSNKESTLISAE